MAAGQRPGGLTALAVLNFVFGGIKAIFVIGMLALFGIAEQASGGEVSAELSKHPQGAILFVAFGLAIATTILLIVSAVGYLGQKRVMGRTMGNLYAVCSLAGSGLDLAYGGNMLGVLLFAVYPLLTLLLINGTFKDDLVN